MVTMVDIERGIGAYLDGELMSLLPQDSAERWIIGSVAAIYIKKKMGDLSTFMNSPIAKEMELVGEDGNINLEMLRDTFKTRMPSTGVVYDKGIVGKIFGSLRFQTEDVDKLYSYITKQEVK